MSHIYALGSAFLASLQIFIIGFSRKPMKIAKNLVQPWFGLNIGYRGSLKEGVLLL